MLFFVSIFGFIGLAVIIGLWTADGFGAPPTFFKIIGTFMGLAFMSFGFGIPLTAFRNRNSSGSFVPPSASDFGITRPTPSRYDCPNCGANVGEADVSPSGDIKCHYCNDWWNVHQR